MFQHAAPEARSSEPPSPPFAGHDVGRWRAWVAIAVIALAMLIVGAGASANSVSSAKQPSTSGHPVEGAWVLNYPDRPDMSPSQAIIEPGGTTSLFTVDGPYTGAWRSTGDRTAMVTLVSTFTDPSTTVRALVEVSPDGSTFTATYTIEQTCTCGESAGQLGPGRAVGTRIVPEPMGSPVAPIPVPSANPLPSAGVSVVPSTAP